MTDICYNEVKFTFETQKEKDDFKANMSSPYSVFSLHKVKSQSEKLLEFRRYGSCSDHWCTNWDARYARIDDETSNSIWYSFDTALCAPVGVYESLRRMYPNASIHWRFYSEFDWREGVLGEEQGLFYGDLEHHWRIA